MPLPAKLLRPGEEIVFDVRPHGWMLWAPCAFALVVVAGGIVAGVVGVPQAAAWAIVAVIGVALGWLLLRYLRWMTTSFVLTTDRFAHRSGILGRRTRAVPLHQVADISCRQGLLGRLVGVGDLVVDSTGRDGPEVFSGLGRPGTLERDIHGQVAATRERWVPRAGERSIPEQIDQLADLARRGVLTREEFDAKKAQLLDRL